MDVRPRCVSLEQAERRRCKQLSVSDLKCRHLLDHPAVPRDWERRRQPIFPLLICSGCVSIGANEREAEELIPARCAVLQKIRASLNAPCVAGAVEDVAQRHVKRNPELGRWLLIERRSRLHPIPRVRRLRPERRLPEDRSAKQHRLHTDDPSRFRHRLRLYLRPAVAMRSAIWPTPPDWTTQAAP